MSPDNNRRQVRDRKRADKREALLAFAAGPGADRNSGATDAAKEMRKPSAADTSALVSGLASLHVSLDDPVDPSASPTRDIPTIELTADPEDEGDGNDDDVFASPTTAAPFATFDARNASPGIPSGGKGEGLGQKGLGSQGQSRLIVEALVVRKMSLDEAFLDFGGFALM